MANVGEEVFFHIELFDKNGDPGDPQTIRGWVQEQNAAAVEVFFDAPRLIGSGIYDTSWILLSEGEHWLRVETTGNIQTVIEKRFDGAKRMVTIP